MVSFLESYLFFPASLFITEYPFSLVMYAPCRGFVFMSLIYLLFEVTMFPGLGQWWLLVNVDILQFGWHTFQSTSFFSWFVSRMVLLSKLHKVVLPTWTVYVSTGMCKCICDCVSICVCLMQGYKCFLFVGFFFWSTVGFKVRFILI